MLNWFNPKLVIGRDRRGGTGLFAADKILPGELLVVYGGYVITLDAYHELPEIVKQFFYQIQHDPVLLYGPIDEDQLGDGDYVNHSCNPNAGFAGTIHLVSMCEIEPGEEVTFDYAMCMSNEFGNMECSCDSAECRGFITGDDWMIESLQLRYKGYFQPYIEKMITITNRTTLLNA
jgi:SET domain-containing protein